MRIWTIHINFLEQFKLGSESASNELQDFSMSAIFLAKKLVARESKELEALTGKFLVHFGQCLIV